MVVLSLLFVICLGNSQAAAGIRFVLDKEECFSQTVPYEGDKVHASFVVIKAADSSWHHDVGVDLVVKDPNGDQIHDFRDKTLDRFDFVAQKNGLHRFCFASKSPHRETIDFDLHVSHFMHLNLHLEEHFAPLFDQIAKLEEALDDIQFEQHWLAAQTDRQALVNEEMSRRTIHKALVESAALVGASVLQVFLLRRLFEQKLGTSRVQLIQVYLSES